MGVSEGFDDETGEMNSTGYLWAGISGAVIYYSLEGCMNAAEAYNTQLRKEAEIKFGLIPLRQGVMVNVSLNF